MAAQSCHIKRVRTGFTLVGIYEDRVVAGNAEELWPLSEERSGALWSHRVTELRVPTVAFLAEHCFVSLRRKPLPFFRHVWGG